MQTRAEAEQLARGPPRDQLTFEVMHNLVLEATRMGIEVKNLKMRVESLSSRLEFNERRARVLESAVVYKAPEQPADRGVQQPAGTGRPDFESRQSEPRPQADYRPRPEAAQERRAPSAPPPAAAGAQPGTPEGPGQRSRRRRRRRGRRGGASAATVMGAGPVPDESSSVQADGHSGDAHESDHEVEPSPSDDPPDAPDFAPGDPEPDDAQ
jgi:hypothetical protein